MDNSALTKVQKQIHRERIIFFQKMVLEQMCIRVGEQANQQTRSEKKLLMKTSINILLHIQIYLGILDLLA